ncbi:hypothetical protein C8N36_106158 [Pelagimonas varians]|uniref:CREG-like beta-barrel domain-containing protein n=1 Tax=Pelagimonas varians TaxID=696760 RepID=A0A238K3Z5_9RHOB|nr:pyridoxamine 5'-phosphate oxidase family protein [Pelagimonas varians]PYG30450.1 hypothetical protein C8N36_106158 [Pelagimonas varians]SMX37585.1 hypothetical protein PEV8663_01132 [Pelagimonas varians]
MTNPIRPTDDEARLLAQKLLQEARFAALGFTDPNSNSPMVTRISCVPCPSGGPLSLVSDLSAHTQALRRNPACAFLIGEPKDKGDPLTHPRLSLQGTAEFINHSDADYQSLAPHYLGLYPKAKLYIGFTDFSFLRLKVRRGFLNGGFGKAFELTPQDLAPNRQA